MPGRTIRTHKTTLMIPSRKFFALLLAVAATAGFAMAAGELGVTEQDDGETQARSAESARSGERSSAPLLPLQERSPTGLTAQEAIEAHASAAEGPEQPIPFNHRFHAQELGMQCAYCHGGTESSPVATIPSVQLCMGCHLIVGAQLEPIQELRGYWDRGEPVPWERVYKVPDFVQFPHEAHVRNEIQCAECHGPVEDMDRVSKVTSLDMGWCLECHMDEGADTDYATDRLLAANFPPPEPPQEGQPIGQYPRTIDQEYGATRGPIECTACHY